MTNIINIKADDLHNCKCNDTSTHVCKVNNFMLLNEIHQLDLNAFSILFSSICISYISKHFSMKTMQAVLFSYLELRFGCLRNQLTFVTSVVTFYLT